MLRPEQHTGPDGLDSYPSLTVPGDRPLRVLHLINALVLAGMEYGVIKQVNRLDRRRFAPLIACLMYRSEVTHRILDPSVPVFEFHKKDGRDLTVIAKLATLMRRERIDIVHSHNWQTMFYGVRAAGRAGVPVLIHGEHGHDETAEPTRRLLMKRWLARRCTHLVAVSGDLEQELVRRWRMPTERVTWIPNGVDVERFHPGEAPAGLREELGLSPEHRVVLNIGGLRRIKDHPTLFRAFARVHSTIPSARLLIVGSDYQGGLKEELETLAESLGAREAIVFAGGRQDVPELLRLCDVYVNSSIFEGMSNTVLEAMATGKPVVATDVGGNPELVRDGETGFLVPVSDPESMAGRVRALLADPDLRGRLGAASRQEVEWLRPMSAMIDSYSLLYEETWWRRRLREHMSGRKRAKRWVARGIQWSGLGWIKRRSRPSALRILTYHRVLPVTETFPDPFREMIMARDLFEGQIAWLARNRRVLALSEAVERLRLRDLPEDSVAITFDDGYADNYEYAWPVLTRYRLPATFFVVTGVVDGRGGLWWDETADAVKALWDARPVALEPIANVPPWIRDAFRDPTYPLTAQQAANRLVHAMNDLPRTERRGLRDALVALAGTGEGNGHRMVTWEQLREMQSCGMEVAPHTVTHEFLDELSVEEIRSEVVGSLDAVRDRIGAPARSFSYPRGRHSETAVPVLTQAGVRAAVTTRPGLNLPGVDPLRLARLDAAYANTEAGFDSRVFAAELEGWFSSVVTARAET